MLVIRHLIDLADAYRAAETGIDDGQLSWKVFGDSKKLSALRNGRDITVSRYNAALGWFAQNWPDGAVWPVGIPRPENAEVPQ